MNVSKRASLISASPTLAINAKLKSMQAEGRDICGFGAGEPDFDTPDYIKQAAIKAINDGFTKYTASSGIIELRKAICDKLRMDNGLHYEPSQIVVSNGAKQALLNAFYAICDAGDEVIIAAPYWVSYPELIKLAGGAPIIVYTSKRNGYKPSITELKNAITPKTRAIVVNSPCNPTGAVYTEEELRNIAKLAIEKDIYIVSDEIYEKIIYTPHRHISIATLFDEMKSNTIIVNGFSKTYAMTGWRIGYTASNEELARVMGNVQSHATSNANSIAQKAALAALISPSDEIDAMVAEFKCRRDYMVERIKDIRGISCIEPGGAFYVFVDISSLIGRIINGISIGSANQFVEVLLNEACVAVVPGNGFGANSHIRLSYATSMETIKKGLDRMEKFLSGIRWEN